MVEAVKAAFRNLLLVALLAFSPAVFAHRLDEYLQATIVAIEPDGIRLEINLTPGVAVADRVLAIIDRNRDGVISTNEASDYAELVKGELVVQLDEQNVGLELRALNFPETADLRSGLGIIQMEFSVMSGPVSSGLHKLTLDNRHLPASSVYLFNAALPRSTSIQIKEQKRNENQSIGEIVFDVNRPANSPRQIGLVASLTGLFVVAFACIANRKFFRMA
jgi:hypothetical protein